MLPRSGSGAGGGCEARMLRRISSRLSGTPPPVHCAETLRGRLGQLALAAPCVPAIVDDSPRQFRQEPAQEFSKEPISPRPSQDPATHLRPDALAERYQACSAELA